MTSRNFSHSDVFPDQVFELLTQKFRYREEAIAASGQDRERICWGVFPLQTIGASPNRPLQEVAIETHTATLIYEGCYRWLPDREDDRAELVRLLIEERDRRLRSFQQVHNFQQFYAAMSDEVLIAAAERDQLYRIALRPSVILLAGRELFASRWKRLHPEVAHRCRYVSFPDQLRDLRRDSILIRLNLYEQNPVYHSGLLRRFMPLKDSPLLEYDERFDDIEAMLNTIAQQQQSSDRPAEVTPLLWDDPDPVVKRPTPAQLQESLEELDRLCANTIALRTPEGQRTSEGQALKNLTHHLRTFGDSQTAEFALALRQKFDDTEIMTPLEYRRIRRNAFADEELIAGEY
jgi:hypothetical protein